MHHRSRRGFLADVGRVTLAATVGPAVAIDLGLVSAALMDRSETELKFGELEPLVTLLQETPVERLQSVLAAEVRGGVSLKKLVAAGALANARTFGGEDYVGFHTFMALSPALKMASMMPAGSEALPVFKVLYRNTGRIQEFGGRPSEVLRGISASTPRTEDTFGPDEAELHSAILTRDTSRAEQLLHELALESPLHALDALIPIVQDHPEVHRTVLPYRAWDMQQIVGPQHALTLLRQSLRYCVRAQPQQRQEWSEHARMLTRLLEEHRLAEKEPGTLYADDTYLQELSRTFSTVSPADAAGAAAEALAAGFQPSVIGEAICLAASELVLRDRGRLPQWEDRLKPAGSVHGDSVGVHASDAANAWRNLARVSSGRNAFACLIIGAWQVARDRDAAGNLQTEMLPVRHHLDRLTGLSRDALLLRLEEAIQNNLQAHAAAIVQSYAQLSLPADPLFDIMLRYAVSEDGALHAEKYFHTVWEDFHLTRPAFRWQHLVALARVTASEYGRPAAGQLEARELLGLS